MGRRLKTGSGNLGVGWQAHRRGGHRARGEGWEVWLDREGYLWTRDTADQHGLAASARVEAMAQLVKEHRVRSVIVDDRVAMGSSTPAARAAYTRFMQDHPGIHVACVTSDPECRRIVFEVRSGMGGEPDRLQLFGSVQAAKAWLRKVALPSAPL